MNSQSPSFQSCLLVLHRVLRSSLLSSRSRVGPVQQYNRAWYHDLVKQLSYYLYLFYFIFLSRLTIQERSAEKYHITNITHYKSYVRISHITSHMLGYHSVTSYDRVI